MNEKKNNNNLLVISLIVSFLVITGIIIGFLFYKNKENKNPSKQQKTENKKEEKNKNEPSHSSPLVMDLPAPSKEIELERYLLEKRLDLKKYFVFNLQKEIKLGSVDTGNTYVNGRRLFLNNARYVVPALANHLSKLIGEEKAFIVFAGKYTNETSKEWSSEELDQLINNGEEWWIIFDKTKIDSDVCNYFAKQAGLETVTFPASIVLAVQSHPEVQIFKSKEAALNFLKNNDPALIGQFN